MKNTSFSILFYIITTTALLAQTGSIRGTVSGSGIKIPMVSVQLLSTNYITTTSDSGNFTFNNIPPNTYHIKVIAFGYKPFVDIITVKANEQSTVELWLEEDIQLLNEVVITATRTERNVADIPIPVTVISNEQIKSMGSMRLDEVLAEQTGLNIVADHGSGIQLQGFSADYTLIMINGQPLLGRTGGTFDLSRISINNIKQIEITKGPSSSLYGSEALAGVINIITEDPKEGVDGSIQVKHRTYNTSDIAASVNSKHKKLSSSIQLNKYSSEGYDLTPESVAKTVPQFGSYTVNGNFIYETGKNSRLKLNTRYYTENQTNKLETTNSANETQLLDVNANQNDWIIAPSFVHDFTKHSKISIINYTSGYNTETNYTYFNNGAEYEKEFFNQLYNKSEVQADVRLNKTNTLTLGSGFITESLSSDRYAETDNFYTTYGFVQNEWTPFGKKLAIIAGGRFDAHSEYTQQVSPKLAAQYKIKKWISVKGAFGTGFKAPDFRQLFLKFTNPTAGYSVLGSSIVHEGMQELESQGQIQQILIDYNTINTIKAESSLSYNVGIDLKPHKTTSLSVNLFRNDITDLIESAPIAIKTNGQQVYSYFNLNKVYTQGLESNLSIKVKQNWVFSTGYQYLEAKDKGVIENIEEGSIYARNNETKKVERVSVNSYGGLFNRSKHSGNAKIFYKNIKNNFDVNLRCVYRGAFGFGDVNGNAILDSKEEYTNDYFTWHFSLSKHLLKNNKLSLQVGMDNIFATTNAYIPSMPGRLTYVGATYRFTKQKNTPPTE